MKKERILFVVNVDWFFISHRLPIAIKAMSDGYEVHLACSNTGKLQKLAELGINIHELSFSRSGNGLLNELGTVTLLRKVIAKVQPNILHAVTIKPVIYSGIVLHSFMSKPKFVAAISGLGYVFSADNLRAKLTRLFVSVLYKFAFKHKNKIVIFQNKTDESILSRVTRLKPIDKELIRGSGADLNVYKYQTEPKAKSIKIAMACRLLKEKGVYEYVEAAKIVKSKFNNVEFILAGTPDLDNPNTVSQLELEQWQASGVISVIGHCDNIPQLFSESHVVTMPSYYGEGVPKVLIEAAACGRPIVTTCNPGCRDAIIPEKTGILVPVKDADSLADALIRLIESKSLRHEMGSKAREYAIKEFNIDNVVQKHLDIYRALLTRQ
ncbi:glycosyltransferase family 4 protein [Shewanella sp. D64]|uniref:glycosyltransferase family 4 protein n=1 Tax=unclassified Shewanella TaxID=196818 RepID=UPI0022BA3B91|nr:MULTISPECIES: glycosyltransferase family 4 protein [unclassified Shewanella]MEC4727740.1 glycosyltransferase family 4 protein [Shewanella sp. D64]MEC4737503.1 glycosyltransferase family 4 protein [Shewanella sp. E94]WBJ97313.1 glycosyltransferase family 4 protein [Shewanella sp. MTB7]